MSMLWLVMVVISVFWLFSEVIIGWVLVSLVGRFCVLCMMRVSLWLWVSVWWVIWWLMLLVELMRVIFMVGFCGVVWVGNGVILGCCSCLKNSV